MEVLKVKKYLVLLVLLAILVTPIMAEKIVLWTAPNMYQEQFWKAILDEWKVDHPEIEVEWKTIPASGSSEEAILTAIVTGQAPDLCTNIFSGFAAQLIEADQLEPLDNFSDFDELLATRKMEEAVKGWDFDGSSYVFPIYSNPMLFWWRKDMLAEAGFDTPPRTYSEVYALAEKICKPKELYAVEFLKGKNWWDRWFDFITLYYAASDGKPYIDTERGKATFNDEAGIAVVEYGQKLFDMGWTSVDMMDNPLFTGRLAGQLMGPWSIPWATNLFPDVFPSEIVMSYPPVPDFYPEDKPVKTFADTKGMVIFKNSKHKEAAWTFMKWVYSDPKHDEMWFEMTGLPPVRADLTTNEIFKPVIDANPMIRFYAEAVPNSVPPALISKTTEVQDIMTTDLTEPIYLVDKSAEDIINNAIKKINRELF
jgi:multiple sugar transport system substrate-binding protein